MTSPSAFSWHSGSEQAVPRAERVLLILTEAYKSKADQRQRGTGYEGQVISAELYGDGLRTRFKSPKPDDLPAPVAQAGRVAFLTSAFFWPF